MHSAQSLSRKKIAMLVTRMDIGGVPDHIMTLIAGLSEEFSFTVICDHIHPSHAKLLSELGVRMEELPMRRTISLTRDFRSFSQLLTLLKREKFDIIHTHMSKAALLGAIAARLTRTPVSINTAHNLGFIALPNPIAKALFWVYDRLLFALGTDAVIVVSDFVKQKTLAAHLVSPQKLHAIHNGIRTGAIQHRNLADPGTGKTGMTILCVARLVWFKGLHTLIAAMPAIVHAHPDCRLLIAGDGELEQDLREQAERLGVKAQVQFLGLRDDVPQLLAQAAIFVLPSVSEGLPISILEAMETGLPVVATSVGGIPELVKNDVTGLLVPPQNPDKLASAICRLLADGALRERMGIAAKLRAIREFSASAMQRRTAALYREMLEAGEAGKGNG